MCPRSGLWHWGASAKTTLLEATLLRTPDWNCSELSRNWNRTSLSVVLIYTQKPFAGGTVRTENRNRLEQLHLQTATSRGHCGVEPGETFESRLGQLAHFHSVCLFGPVNAEQCSGSSVKFPFDLTLASKGQLPAPSQAPVNSKRGQGVANIGGNERQRSTTLRIS